MKLSTRTRYGIRAILVLAGSYGKGPLQLKVIAEEEDISLKYLEQLMSVMKAAGFVRSIRGAKGGYVLAKRPCGIKLSEIFDILEGAVVTVECLQDNRYCKRVSDCVTRHVWFEVQQAIRGVLDSVTLQDLVDRGRKSDFLNYQI